jgi:hypothetical protein
VAESLNGEECLRLLGATRVGRLAYTGREGPTVVAVVYKLHEGSVVFHPLQGTFTQEDLRTGIAQAEYQVAFEIDQIDPDARRMGRAGRGVGASRGDGGRARVDHQRRRRPVPLARGRRRAPDAGAA